MSTYTLCGFFFCLRFVPGFLILKVNSHVSTKCLVDIFHCSYMKDWAQDVNSKQFSTKDISSCFGEKEHKECKNGFAIFERTDHSIRMIQKSFCEGVKKHLYKKVWKIIKIFKKKSKFQKQQHIFDFFQNFPNSKFFEN